LAKLRPNPLVELTASPNPLAGLGEGPRELYRRRGSKRETKAEKRGYLGKKGREQKGEREW